MHAVHHHAESSPMQLSDVATTFLTKKQSTLINPTWVGSGNVTTSIALPAKIQRETILSSTE